MTGLCFLDIVSGLAFIALAAFGVVLAAAALAFAAAGDCLIGELNPYGLIPAMPYASALVFALALLALCARPPAAASGTSHFCVRACAPSAAFRATHWPTPADVPRCPHCRCSRSWIAAARAACARSRAYR